MFPYLGQSTQAQVWLDVQFPDFRILAGMQLCDIKMLDLE